MIDDFLFVERDAITNSLGGAEEEIFGLHQRNHHICDSCDAPKDIHLYFVASSFA